MSINFEYYKIFYYVAKYQNISKAAKALQNNQPNITRVMKLLEGELGCQLMVRSNKGVVLTEDGERLYGYVQPAVEQLQTAEEELTGRAKLGGGVVTIGASETALHLFLFDVIHEYHEKHPDVRVRIHNYSTPQAMAALKNAQIDFAVVTTPVKAEAPIKSKTICNFKSILAGGSNYMELASQKRSLSEVAGCSFVSLEKHTSTYDMYSRYFTEHGLEFAPDIEVATADLILPMLENNLGIGFVPERVAAEAIKAGQIYPIEIEEGVPKREISLIYDTKRGLSAAAGEFRKTLMKKHIDIL